MEQQKIDRSETVKEIMGYIHDMRLKNSELLRTEWDRSPKFISIAESAGLDRFGLRKELAQQEFIKIGGDGVRIGTRLKM